MATGSPRVGPAGWSRGASNPAMSLKERTARVLIERVEQMGRATAEAMGDPYGNETWTAEDERRLFWLRDPQVNEQALWRAGKTPAEISKALYPHRWQVLTAGGRIKLEDQTAWAERQLRLGPPSGTPTPPSAQEGAPGVPIAPKPRGARRNLAREILEAPAAPEGSTGAQQSSGEVPYG